MAFFSHARGRILSGVLLTLAGSLVLSSRAEAGGVVTYDPDQSMYDVQEISFDQQTAASTTISGYAPGNVGNYDMEAGVTPDLNGYITSAPFTSNPTLTDPNSNSYTLTWNSSDDAYKPDSSSPAFISDAEGDPTYYSSTSLLNSTFPDGSYSFDIESNTRSLSVVTSTPTFTIPVLGFTSGTWTGSGSSAYLSVTPGAGLTFNLNSFAGYNSTNGGAIYIQLTQTTGVGAGTEVVDYSYNDIPALTKLMGNPNRSLTATDPSSYMIPGGDLVAGDSYELQVEYDQVTSEDTSTFSAAGVTDPIGLAIDSDITFATITATPEPSTILLLFLAPGLLFLGRRCLRA